MPSGLEYFSNLTEVSIEPYDPNSDEDFPFLSYFNGKKLKISGDGEQVLFYAVRIESQILPILLNTDLTKIIRQSNFYQKDSNRICNSIKKDKPNHA